MIDLQIGEATHLSYKLVNHQIHKLMPYLKKLVNYFFCADLDEVLFPVDVGLLLLARHMWNG